MKHIKKYNESNQEELLTWNKIINDPDIDFILGSNFLGSSKKIQNPEEKKEYLYDIWAHLRGSMKNFDEPLIFDEPDPKKLQWNTYVKDNIKLCSNYNLSVVLVFKNDELFAVISIYELHGSEIFKEVVVVYGHENIILYDIQDLTFKNIKTR